jgi:hypothetical protein
MPKRHEEVTPMRQEDIQQLNEKVKIESESIARLRREIHQIIVGQE